MITIFHNRVFLTMLGLTTKWWTSRPTGGEKNKYQQQLQNQCSLLYDNYQIQWYSYDSPVGCAHDNPFGLTVYLIHPQTSWHTGKIHKQKWLTNPEVEPGSVWRQFGSSPGRRRLLVLHVDRGRIKNTACSARCVSVALSASSVHPEASASGSSVHLLGEYKIPQMLDSQLRSTLPYFGLSWHF